MIEIITNEHQEVITTLFNAAKEDIKIISPFLSIKTAKLLSEAAKRGLDCSFITRFYLQDFLDRSNTLDGLQIMLDAGVKLYALIGLHTKLYIFDSDDAIVGSANFTEGGLVRNIELSIYLKEENTIADLCDYYDDIIVNINKDNDGIITQTMLDDYKERYQKNEKFKNKQQGGKSIVSTIRGAALDTKAKRIKEDLNEIFSEIEKHKTERLTDPVYGAMGGEQSVVSYKNFRNIILKFSASAKKRADGNKPMLMHAFNDNGQKIYISNFSSSKLKSAQAIEEDDETYFCVHSYDKNGNECPLIVGRGVFKAFSNNNDIRTKTWKEQYDWLLEYPFYCIIAKASIINAPISCGIPLREVTQALGYKTYKHTLENPEKYTKERVDKAHRQQAMLYLSTEAKEFIDSKLNALGEKFGWSTYESDL